MSDELRNNVAQALAWLGVFIGGISVELWIALAGLVISAILAFTNYQSRKLQDRLLLADDLRKVEQDRRDAELHELEKARLKAGMTIPPEISHHEPAA